MTIRKAFAIFLLISLCFLSFAQQENHYIYKQLDTIELSVTVISPQNIGKGVQLPAMIFFFGGGWNTGTIEQFRPHAEHFSKMGIVCFLADYRVKKRQGSSPIESLKDAKSAIRYIRSNADKFHIDPDRIIASGGSAGGHLAAATAFAVDFNESSDDLSVSCIPNALVLFNPVIDNGPGGFGYDRIGEKYKDFSPIHNIKTGAPPTIFFLGTKDSLIPVETAEYYKTVMERVGSRCDLELYEGEGHGFFNFNQPENYKKTVASVEQFLISLEYITE